MFVSAKPGHTIDEARASEEAPLARTRLAPFLAALLLTGAGCAAEVPPPKTPHIPLTPPAELCGDSSLGEHGLCLPSERIDRLLKTARFEVKAVKGTASGIGGAKVLVLHLPDEALTFRVKWKQSKHGGDGLNNTPRMEIAAYEAQKFFLDPDEYVVPPTVGRCLPKGSFDEPLGSGDWTFDGVACLYGILSYWIEGVTDEGVYDLPRFARDASYREGLGRMNLFTYLIGHRDTRLSNFIISKDPRSPRTFSIDNGLAFSGLRNPRLLFVDEWNEIIVPSLPRRQIARLRRVTRADLDTLAVVAQYQLLPDAMVEVPATAPLSTEEGVRRVGDVIQLGLTTEEIDEMEERLHDLIAQVDRGWFPVR
ncbi:MAG: hypothetical protein ABI193_00785 [Minicystis sp.]